MTLGKTLLIVIGGLYLILAGSQIIERNWPMALVYVCYGIGGLALLSVTK